jgi:UDP-3-O-[3-hydroxymyristoyl] glucosamine N-acyltransferase
MQDIALARGACIVADQPYLYFAKLTQLWKHMGRCSVCGGSPQCGSDADAQVHPSASIGPLCVMERGARIGATPCSSHA